MIKEDEVRAMVEVEARAEFGGEYRGYSYRGLNWRAGAYSFRVYAYNPISPIHPLDIIFCDSPEVHDWREWQCGHGRAAAFNLKALIDSAYETPDKFKAATAQAS